MPPTQVQQAPPPDVHHDPHKHHPNAISRDALLQALGSILSPKRPGLTGRSSSTSTVDSSRSSSGTASPAPPHLHIPGQQYPHPHHGPASPMPPPVPHSTPMPSPLHHPHGPSPLAHHSESADAVDAPDAHLDATQDAPTMSIAQAPTPVPAVRPKIIDSLKSKNGAWDALIHGSFS